MFMVAEVEAKTSGDITVMPGRTPTGMPLSEGITWTPPAFF